MPRITISYRRDDSGVISGRIFDRLVGHYGRDAVFRDIDDIPIGVDFRAHIERVFDETDIVLAIVGPHWVGLLADTNRLADAADPVRIEIEGALRRGAPLLPVLVLGAVMPSTTELPESMHDFAYRNAIQIDAGQDFDVHIARLIRGVDQIYGQRHQKPAFQANTAAWSVRSPWVQGAAIGGIVAVAVTGALGYGSTDQRKSSSPQEYALRLPNAPVSSPSQQSDTPGRFDTEVLFWNSIMNSSNAADFEEYISKYPHGQFAGLARNRVSVLVKPSFRSGSVSRAGVAQEFYMALAKGDGMRASAFVVPEKQNDGPLSPNAMTVFYRNLLQPLKLLNVVELSQDLVEAQYNFVTRTGHVCNGRSLVQFVERDDRILIQSIKALNGC